MIAATTLILRLRLARLAMRSGQWLADVIAPELLATPEIALRCPSCSAEIRLGGAA